MFTARIVINCVSGKIMGSNYALELLYLHETANGAIVKMFSIFFLTYKCDFAYKTSSLEVAEMCSLLYSSAMANKQKRHNK